ncbi:MAG: branched-chain amino acid ABC transporter permease [Actinomycetota bacterium]
MNGVQARLRSSGPGLAIAIVVMAFLLYVPQYYEETTVNLFTQALYFAIAAMGLNILTGYNGQVSIGHGAFFALGGYTAALLMRDGSWPFLQTIPVVAVVCFAFGALVGFPALRVKGLYLALVTLGLAVTFPDLTQRLVNREDGIWDPNGEPGTVALSIRDNLQPPNWFDWFPQPIAERFDDWIGARDQWTYYVALTLGLVLLVVAVLIVRSRFGRSLVAVRDHEAAAATVGVNLARVRVMAFAISATYAGVAGAIAVLLDRSASSEKVEVFQDSIFFLVAVVIGGTATVIGPIVGGFLLVFFQDWANEQETLNDVLDPQRAKLFSPALFGIVLVIAMYVLPDGLVGGTRRLMRRASRRRPPPETPVLTQPRGSTS